MNPHKLDEKLLVCGQITPEDIDQAASAGVRLIINNRPDGEEPGQPLSADLKAKADALSIAYRYIPISGGNFDDASVMAFGDALASADGPTLAFCRTGTRATTLWALSQAGSRPTAAILSAANAAGYDLSQLRGRIETASTSSPDGPAADRPAARYDVVIVGGGAGGIATATSILKRDPKLSVAIIEPRTEHYYQPGWTMVGAGVFEPKSTCHSMASVMPKGVTWLREAAQSFQPEQNQVTTANGSVIGYRALVVAPGNMLDWDAIDGLAATLGQNGVTSNYRYDTAPYTWELVRNLREGVALFTQPPMPIKCAGAPQKAMYLSCDNWLERGVLNNIDVAFHNAGGVLFGVKDYVPALMGYVERYGIDLNFESTLIAVDGAAKTATFREKTGEVTRAFDMMHVTPPQIAPRFVADSLLADKAGYVEVDQVTMQHVRYPNIFGLGDGGSTPNAKTAAAARKQAPIVAVNLLAILKGGEPVAGYDGYGSCPLTVEKGKIVLAEFGYGGKLMPSFPKWLIDGTQPARLSWLLKSEALPWIYWNGMLKGHEWLVKPQPIERVRQAA
ncbi:TIGR01244 family protein [Sphingobium sp. GW456-12-10-14-TSB1]|uniref:TIGR01244 family phosphatase n=1 Tax=Sphingobium psychrophilum TaxID=2728834 RepID=A0A7X9WSQ3_9SPHN|nr:MULTISPECIES: bifunctional protein tyrosine phosphatase family protein/NAD(P)/FAD-dependent oxidoreductase [Sphingobium]MBS86379.1 TIGR01244 family phosphatase [Sphingobium sp.]MBS87408.1 TIGR01244 family phosphatase [Sphingobium sp.]NML09231.1 TIGR01244 family phosphatase [Sphingobium psychrophilum]OUC53151.1 TIGR01244 family protein [Sphingobium sp. GW456-12-10-14-TSB1]